MKKLQKLKNGKIEEKKQQNLHFLREIFFKNDILKIYY